MENLFCSKGLPGAYTANPGHKGDPAALRANIHPGLLKTGFEDVVMNIAKLIDTLPENPIVIRHSMAGLAIQKLVESGKAIAGVSIDGAPAKNVFPPLSTVIMVWPAVNFFKRHSHFLGSREWYKKAFFNTLPAAEADKA